MNQQFNMDIYGLSETPASRMRLCNKWTAATRALRKASARRSST